MSSLWDWVRSLWSWEQHDIKEIAGLKDRVTLLESKVQTMSADFDALKANYEEFKTVVNADLTALLQKVTDLQAQIDATPSDTAAIKDLANEIAADVQAAKDRIPD